MLTFLSVLVILLIALVLILVRRIEKLEDTIRELKVILKKMKSDWFWRVK